MAANFVINVISLRDIRTYVRAQKQMNTVKIYIFRRKKIFHEKTNLIKNKMAAQNGLQHFFQVICYLMRAFITKRFYIS